MSPVMVGRAGPFAHLAGIVEAAEVMTGDQPSVALVSGEAGHRQDAARSRAGGDPAGRDDDARRHRPAGLDGTARRRRGRAARRRRRNRGRSRGPRGGRVPDGRFGARARPDGARDRGPPLDRRGQRQRDRPHHPAALAPARRDRHLPSGRALPGAAGRRARAAARAAARGRADPPRSPRSHGGRRPRRRDPRRPAAVGGRRGRVPAQWRRSVRGRGADSLLRPAVGRRRPA